MSDEERKETLDIVEMISAAGGAMAGTALTLVAGPFVGSASGEVVARVFARVGYEVQRRLFAPRQESRIGEAFASAAAAAQERLLAGEQIRSDGFFESRGPDQGSPAEEIMEGMLRTAADEWEQRKVPYIGRMFTAASFDGQISAAEASYFLKLAERLTYQQVVLMAFWDAAQEDERPFRQEVISATIRTDEGRSRPTAMILAEMNDLATLGLLGVTDSEGRLVRVNETIGGMSGFSTYGGSVNLTTVQPTGLGQTLIHMMGLDQIPDDDLWLIARALHGDD